jgi:hypothetical protein
MKLFRWIGMFPSRWLLASIVLYVANLCFGPYRYIMTSGFRAWAYLISLFFLLWIGLFLGENHRRLRNGVQFGYHRLHLIGEFFLAIVGLILLAASLYNLRYYLDVGAGGLGVAAGEARNQLDQLRLQGFQRPLIVRLADGLASASVAISVILISARQLRYGPSLWIAVSSPIVAAVTQLLSGGRNGAAFIICTLAAAFMLRSYMRMPDSAGVRMLKRLLVVFGACAFVVMLLMFAWRAGLTGAELLEVSTPFVWRGEVQLREPYAELNRICGGQLSGVYMLSYYAGHSGPFFTALFEESTYTQLYGGLFHLRLYVLAFGGGGQVYIEMVHSQPFYGLYPTAIQGLLLDFGVWGGALAALAIGLAIGAIANRAMNGGPIAGCFLPMLLVVVAISPIYYFNWGGADFALTMLALVTTLLLGIKALIGREVFVKFRPGQKELLGQGPGGSSPTTSVASKNAGAVSGENFVT